MTISRKRWLLTRLWLPIVALTVVAIAAFTIEATHGIFGSQDRTKSSGNKFSIVQFNPKNIRYEIFGEFGGWGRVSYWDVNSEPVEVNLVGLPWTHTESTVLTTATADVTAQVAGGDYWLPDHY